MSTPQQPQQPSGSSPWPYGPPPQPPAGRQGRPSRVKKWLTHGGAAFIALIVGAAVAGGGEADGGADTAAVDAQAQPAATATVTAEAEPAPTVTETVTATPEPPKKAELPGPATSFEGDGEYLVGTDIKPGTYKTAGSDGEFGCYWARLKDASGEFDAIIANNNLKGPGRVNLNKGEYFQTQRCAEWTRVG
ncbi:hypothetical protein [Streptomyces sp. Tu 2975]|uniref:hypothetical protein n=1 Tax=Streptomyces sp. Tu 2975 TaxID=2676871 RepID=UPI001FC8F575|nr:hypothetical protein [Streptomyces sp. Tu 2975]